jgi:hypothetical protein
MHVGHGRNPLEDEGQLGNVEELLARLVFERDALDPGFDRRSFAAREDLVVFFSAHKYPGKKQAM